MTMSFQMYAFQKLENILMVLKNTLANEISVMFPSLNTVTDQHRRSWLDTCFAVATEGHRGVTLTAADLQSLTRARLMKSQLSQRLLPTTTVHYDATDLWQYGQQQIEMLSAILTMFAVVFLSRPSWSLHSICQPARRDLDAVPQKVTPAHIFLFAKIKYKETIEKHVVMSHILELSSP